MNQYIRTSLGVAVIIIMASTIGFFSWNYYQNNLIDAPVTVQLPIKKSEKPMACTEEAKLCPDGVNYVGRTEVNCEFAECPEVVGLADKLVIDSPTPNETISSPVSVSGRARGTWFSEGSFPVEVYDGNNKLIGTAPINFTPKSAEDTWMTTEFVEFKGEINFIQPAAIEGYLLFKKDNPSGNPEMDESFKLPVKFTFKGVGTEKQIGYIKKVYEEDGRKYLNIDYVQWFSAEEAKKAALEDKQCTQLDFCAPNGFYVRNQNTQIRTFEIAKDAQVFRTTAFDYASSGLKSMDYEEYKNFNFGNIPYDIEITDGMITKITERYIP